MEITNKCILHKIKQRQEKRQLKSNIEAMIIVFGGVISMIGMMIIVYMAYGLTL